MKIENYWKTICVDWSSGVPEGCCAIDNAPFGEYIEIVKYPTIDGKTITLRNIQSDNFTDKSVMYINYHDYINFNLDANMDVVLWRVNK